MKKVIICLIIVLLVAVGGVVAFWQYAKQVKPGSDLVACTMEAKICPDGSSVGRSGPNCEFSTCPAVSIVYVNEEYGFEIILPNSWMGYYNVAINVWTGHAINDYAKTYTGPLINIKNPKTTPQQAWQDIPIMVFTKEQWVLVSGPNATVAVSAAPVGPAKIGENSKYIFATPPRWWGFADALGGQEAAEAVKTFKTF